MCTDYYFQKQTQKNGHEQLMSLWSNSVFCYGKENGYPFQPGSHRRKSDGTHLRDDKTSCFSAFLVRQTLLISSQNKNGRNYGEFGQKKVASWARSKKTRKLTFPGSLIVLFFSLDPWGRVGQLQYKAVGVRCISPGLCRAERTAG